MVFAMRLAMLRLSLNTVNQNAMPRGILQYSNRLKSAAAVKKVTATKTAAAKKPFVKKPFVAAAAKSAIAKTAVAKKPSKVVKAAKGAVAKKPIKVAAASIEASMPSKKAAKDPNAPKRAMSSYMLYVRENRKRLAEENPECKQTQLMSLAGQQWKALTAEDKGIYEGMHAKDKKRYEKEMSSYTPPAGMTASGKRKIKKEKDPNAPKRPSTPYFAFMNEKRAEIKAENPDAGVADIGKLGGKAWGLLDDESKQEYTDEYQAKMEVWRGDMAAYTASLSGAKKAKKGTAAEVPTSSDSE